MVAQNQIPLRFRKSGRVWCGAARETHWATCSNGMTPRKTKEFHNPPVFLDLKPTTTEQNETYNIMRLIIFIQPPVRHSDSRVTARVSTFIIVKPAYRVKNNFIKIKFNCKNSWFNYETLPVFDIIFRKIFCVGVVIENYASVHFITHSLILKGPSNWNLFFIFLFIYLIANSLFLRFWHRMGLLI